MKPGDLIRVRGSRDVLTVRRVYDCPVHGTDVDAVDADHKLRTFAVADVRLVKGDR